MEKVQCHALYEHRAVFPTAASLAIARVAVPVLGCDIGHDVLVEELQDQRDAVGKHQMLGHVLKLGERSETGQRQREQLEARAGNCHFQLGWFALNLADHLVHKSAVCKACIAYNDCQQLGKCVAMQNFMARLWKRCTQRLQVTFQGKSCWKIFYMEGKGGD